MLLRLLQSFLSKQLITAKDALENKQIEDEIIIAKSQNVLICGNGVFAYEDSEELKGLIDSLGGGTVVTAIRLWVIIWAIRLERNLCRSLKKPQSIGV